jgi:hypothetical protein
VRSEWVGSMNADGADFVEEVDEDEEQREGMEDF